MYKYAEIYGGIVRDLRESHLGFTEFASIWDPSAFWLDVTGLTDEEIQVGWILRSSVDRGTYFEAPVPIEDTSTIEYRQREALETLETLFAGVQETAFIFSSLGFRANAGQRAYRDVDGLIKQMTAEGHDTVLFRDYDNEMQNITLADANVLMMEIIKNGQSLYQQKWALEKTIAAITDDEGFAKLDLSFYMSDFFNEPVDESVVETAE